VTTLLSEFPGYGTARPTDLVNHPQSSCGQDAS
jgi:hypothetical protein